MASPVDDLIGEFDRALRAVFASPRASRPLPAGDEPECVLNDDERRAVVGLMRVNHCGEICAQGLYQGQALTSERPQLRDALRQAADEEADHLAWTAHRIAELGGRQSLLNPLWYGGALAMGLVAGRLGDRWNLGFLAETERQVEAHLQGHLDRLPERDVRTRRIVAQMKEDEAAHAATARRLGAAELPVPVSLAMKCAAGVMTRLAYYL